MSLVKCIFTKYTQTVGQRNEIDDMLLLPMLYQKIFGQHVLDPQWTWKNHFHHLIFNIFLFCYVLAGTIECIKSTNDAEIEAEAYYTIIMIVIFPLKLALFIKSRFIFRDLYTTLKTTLISEIRRNPSADITSVLKTGYRIVLSLLCMVIVPVSIYELTTLWNYVLGQRILLSRSTLTLMPMSSPFYEAAWFLHTIFLFEISSTIILDMWFVLLIYFLCAACDGLANILNIEGKKISEKNLLYAKRLRVTLGDFYYTHLKLNEYLLKLIEMYKISALIPLCNAAMCICLNLLLMSKEINWRFAPHMLPMFAEIFAYNWFGELIKTKMSKVKTALINFQWTDMELRDQKAYYTITIFMSKEFGMKTIIGKELSLITMTAVLKITYQAFTVLQSMDG